MFDLDTWLGMLNMCDNILKYLDCNHVSLKFLHIHTCMSWYSLLSGGLRQAEGRCTDSKVDVQKESED